MCNMRASVGLSENLYIAVVCSQAFRDTARYLDLTDWSGDSYNPAEEMDYASQRFAVVDLPEDAAPETQTFDGRTYLTDESFYNSLISGGVQWEHLEKN